MGEAHWLLQDTGPAGSHDTEVPEQQQDPAPTSRPPLGLGLRLSRALCPQGASALFDMIEYYESATHLNISSNKHIGTRGWQAAAHMMRKVGAPAPQPLQGRGLRHIGAPALPQGARLAGPV